MNTASIVIENGQVTIMSAAKNIWLSQHQLADLFGVFVSAIGSNIRSIFKNEILQESKVCRRKANGKKSFVSVYNLEMITALAFRLKSSKAQQYRHWMIHQIDNPVIIWSGLNRDTALN